MVSNTLKIKLAEFLEILERLRRDYGSDPEYEKVRRDLPDDWPM
ncbi:MAG: hypothetical protein ACREQK_17275 [Candidatus Binatia bacterium]